MNRLGIYLEIDSLFDTRMAMLYCINKNYATMLSGDRYNKRTTCDFGDIPYEVFNQVYQLRNKHILNYAIQTNIKYIVKELLVEMYHSVYNVKTTTERVDTPIIYFNINPYDLNDDEKNELHILLTNIYSNENKTFTQCNIEIVDLNIADITPTWVKEHVDYLIMYNGLKWLEYHNAYRRFINCPLYDVTLITADIVYNRNTKKSHDTLLDSTKELFKNMINIEFIFVHNFNYVSINKKEQ